MPAGDQQRLEKSELFRVLLWRVDTLLNAGYRPEQARDLGADQRVDVHEAVELVKSGMAPELAATILLGDVEAADETPLRRR